MGLSVWPDWGGSGIIKEGRGNGDTCYGTGVFTDIKGEQVITGQYPYYATGNYSYYASTSPAFCWRTIYCGSNPFPLWTTTNLTGNPQVVMKCGFTEGAKADGSKVQVPRSISFLGKIYDEGSPLRVALAYEQATEWHRRNPTLEG